MTTLDIIGMLMAPVGAIFLAGAALLLHFHDERKLHQKVAERERSPKRR